jgi:hypothetical protein
MTDTDEIIKVLLEADEDDELAGLWKDVAGEPQPTPQAPDFIVNKQGGLVLFWPQHDRAKEWLTQTAPEEAQFWGDALVVELRYIEDVADAMREAGFLIGPSRRNVPESLLEAFDDDVELIKDIIGPVGPPAAPKTGSVERFGRWANIKVGDKHFCISYLTPVAVYIPGQGIMFTDRDWSHSTALHIAKWAEEIGMTDIGGKAYTYRDIKKRFKRIPQSEITDLFRQEASQVDWGKREMKRARKFRPPVFYKEVEPEHKIELRPYQPPEEF